MEEMAEHIIKLLSLTDAKLDKNVVGMLYHCNFVRNDPTCNECPQYGRKGVSRWLHGGDIAVGFCDHGIGDIPGTQGEKGEI